MRPEYVRGHVRARCPDCEGAVTTFESGIAGKGGFGCVILDEGHDYDGKTYSRTLYVLMRCAGCGRGGLAKVHANERPVEGPMEWFHPFAIESAMIPESAPPGAVAEFREAETCASARAWRAASAMLRSALEKTLKANGYSSGTLAAKIDEAAADGILTESLRKRSHDDIRVLGNDVLHDEWREVTEEEFEAAHHYAQRILEAFYDDRQTVESILKARGRI